MLDALKILNHRKNEKRTYKNIFSFFKLKYKYNFLVIRLFIVKKKIEKQILCFHSTRDDFVFSIKMSRLVYMNIQAYVHIYI